MTRQQKQHTQKQNSPKGKDVLLYGHHPVMMALANKRRQILEIYMVAGALEKGQIPEKIPVRQVNREFLESLVGKDAIHQGIVARCRPLEPVSIDELLRRVNKQENAVIMILDQVTDPHNIGAVMRSAVAFDAAAVIIPEAGAPEETGVLAKSGSGALELVPLIRVPNLVRVMEKLKECGFWCIGMDGYAKQCIGDQKLPAKSVFIMGSEGSGMRRLTQENCDYTMKLPINPAIESLNVSNAAVLTLYEFRRQHPVKIEKGE